MSRAVTEQDFRMPEFRDAKPEDYEFRDDGKLVRKDRWERGIQSIRELVGLNARSFEIPEVVEKVRELVAHHADWIELAECAPEDFPDSSRRVEVRLPCGSLLAGATYCAESKVWAWKTLVLGSEDVAAWREAS